MWRQKYSVWLLLINFTNTQREIFELLVALWYIWYMYSSNQTNCTSHRVFLLLLQTSLNTFEVIALSPSRCEHEINSLESTNTTRESQTNDWMRICSYTLSHLISFSFDTHKTSIRHEITINYRVVLLAGVLYVFFVTCIV